MLDRRTFALRLLIIPFSVICLGLILLLFANIDRLYATIITAWAVLLMLGFGGMAYLNWLPKTPNESEIRHGKFCEDFEKNSRIGQPINTWTNLSFIAAGLTVVLIAGKWAVPVPYTMTDIKSYIPLVYGIVVVFLGPGSMLFHASGKKWAGWFDMISMVAWVGFSFSYTASHLLLYWFQIPLTSIWVMAGGIILIVGVYTAVRGFVRTKSGKETKGSGLDVMYIVAGAWIISEVITMGMIWFGHPPGYRRSTSWFVAAILAYVAAFICWIPSNGEISIAGIKKQWCKPDSWYQGHGFWHIFSAVGALFIYLHFASESPV